MENKKKITIITGIIIFLILIVGATYAYFNITNSTTTSLEIGGSVPQFGTVSLIGSEKEDEVALTLADMSQLNSGEDYTYPTNGQPLTIATISASGNQSDNITYYCTVDVTVTNTLVSGSLNQGDADITYAGSLVSLLKSGGNNILSDTNLVSTNGVLNGNVSTTTTDEFTIISGETITLTKLVTIHNTNLSQNNLSGLDFTTTTEVTNLDCDTVTHRITPVSLVSSGGNDIRGTGGLSSSLTGGMYRYQGAATSTINNYICIGSDTCSTSTMTSSSYDDHTYRIIGIAEDGRMKVIKMGLSNLGDYSSNTLRWYWYNLNQANNLLITSSDDIIVDYGLSKPKVKAVPLRPDALAVDCDWSNATIRTRLNDTSSGYFLNSLGTYASYIDTSSSSKFYSTATIGVSSPAYLSTDNTTATSLYNDEITKTSYSASTSGYKVGLMQLSDYYLAAGDSANCSFAGGTYATCASSWIHLSNNDTRYSSEWTVAYNISDTAWLVSTDGRVSSGYLSYDHSGARPVFYLKSDITLKGSGTKQSPYYIVNY